MEYDNETIKHNRELVKQTNLDRFVYSATHPRFNGGECEAKWVLFGVPKGVIPDQYVEICRGNAIHLHIYRLGSYPKCNKCEFQLSCIKSAHCACEQAEP